MKTAARGRHLAFAGLGLALVTAWAVGGVRPAASLLTAPAMTLTGDKNTIGNGVHNHNAVSINSPTRNRGPNAISNANAGGRTSTRAIFCVRHRHCRAVQR